jgi:hypothetical protein
LRWNKQIETFFFETFPSKLFGLSWFSFSLPWQRINYYFRKVLMKNMADEELPFHFFFSWHDKIRKSKKIHAKEKEEEKLGCLEVSDFP